MPYHRWQSSLVWYKVQQRLYHCQKHLDHWTIGLSNSGWTIQLWWLSCTEWTIKGTLPQPLHPQAGVQTNEWSNFFSGTRQQWKQSSPAQAGGQLSCTIHSFSLKLLSKKMLFHWHLTVLTLIKLYVITPEQTSWQQLDLITLSPECPNPKVDFKVGVGSELDQVPVSLTQLRP